MKTLTLLSISLSTFLVLSCKTTESGLKDASENETNEQLEKSVFAHIERSPCYGKCPTYKMYIYTDGTVKLEGIRFTEKIGNYEATITKEQMQAFTDKANEIGFMEMEDKYDAPITDVPSATISIVIDGKRKEVYRRADYPKSILTFEALFDDLLEILKWTKLDE